MSCNQSFKSGLVKYLESIFYQSDFCDIPNQEFSITEYGAVGDGKFLNTHAIQNCIDAAAQAGGGKIIVPPGAYLSGALYMRSNTALYLEKGAIIRAVQDDQSYPDQWTRIAGIEMDWPAALINIYQLKNVRISGEGTIDGNGKYWWDKFWGDPPRSGGMWVDYTKRDIRWAVDYDCKRVRPLVVYDSEDVQLKDFIVERAGFWTISLTFSKRVHVDGVVIRNNIGGFGPSSDGINSDSSQDILVENCDIDCNDDNLCIKSGRDADGLRVNRPSENIVYRNCISRAGHGLFTIGSETSGGMRNIEVYGLEAVGTNTGIRFKSAQIRGGLIENIYLHDIKMSDVNSPFHFELNWYPEYSYPKIPDNIPDSIRPVHWQILTQRVEPPEKGIPQFRQIRFSDILAEGAEQGIYANAYQEKPMEAFHWKNVTIKAKEAGSINFARNWTMENVKLQTKNGENIILTGCENISLPQLVQAENNPRNPPKKTTPQTDIDSLMALNASILIPYLNTKEMIINPGDTISNEDSISVFIGGNDDVQIQFIEPLGDGFYYSPVEIIHQADQSNIIVRGSIDHNYTFHYVCNNQVNSVEGADRWSFNNDKNTLQIKKFGANFSLTVIGEQQ